jgi:hypothetical protein
MIILVKVEIDFKKNSEYDVSQFSSVFDYFHKSKQFITLIKIVFTTNKPNIDLSFDLS